MSSDCEASFPTSYRGSVPGLSMWESKHQVCPEFDTFLAIYRPYSGCSGLVVEYRTRNREVVGWIHTRSTSSNLQEVANLLRAQANSAFYLQRDGKWIVAPLLWGTGERPVWLIGAMVCLLAALWVQLSVSAGNKWPHNALRYHWLMPISCHFRDCKALLVTSLTQLSCKRRLQVSRSLPLPLHEKWFSLII